MSLDTNIIFEIIPLNGVSLLIIFQKIIKNRKKGSRLNLVLRQTIILKPNSPQ